MASSAKKIDPYAFEPAFERAVVLLCCVRPKFWGAINTVFDPDCLGMESSKLAVSAVRAMSAETGKGPESTVLVMQRLRRWLSEGRVNQAQITDVSDMLDEAEDFGVPDEDGVLNELRPILKRRLQGEAVRKAMTEYSNKGDFAKVKEIIQRADTVGVIDRDTGIRLGSGSFVEIERLKLLSRMPTGILELDGVLSGGCPRGAMGVAIGGAGDGKSMFLGHVVASNVLEGAFAAYATLEVPEPVVLARIKANMTGIPIDNILDNETDECRKRLEAIPNLGTCIVKDFPSKGTEVQDLKAWVEALEDQYGRKLDLLAVDYGDLLSAKVRGKEGEYEVARQTYEGMRLMAHEKKLVCWTASQSKRKEKRAAKNATKDLDDVADSIHKVRVADIVITLNVEGDGDSLLYYVAKHRTGKSRIPVGPVPVDFACGMVAPVLRGDPQKMAKDAERLLKGQKDLI